MSVLELIIFYFSLPWQGANKTYLISSGVFLSRGSERTRLGNEEMSLSLNTIVKQLLYHDVKPYPALIMSCCKRSSVASSLTPEVRAPS